MSRVNFIFVLHFHQPVGQLEWVYERIYNNCYKILLDILLDHPKIKIAAHISGPLLLYMLEKHSEWIDGVKELVKRGSLELLGGAFGEAILPVIPREDMYMQIRLYIELFREIFGYKPRGFWLAERVWEPSVVEPLAINDIEYTIIDDYILPKIVNRDEAGYSWLTENDGHRLKILFVDERIRYILPWESIESVIKYIVSRGSDKGDRYVLWGSDAEKFGEWSQREWASKWLREFIEKLEENSSIISTITPSEYLDRYGVKGLIYPVYGSYDKMMYWSSSYFRNFFVKYRESNYMHKRLLWLRRKLKKLNAPEDAWRYYYFAQCNDAYWHGLFGGIYLPHLRQTVYENMIKAEVIAENNSNYFASRDMYSSIEDIDFDGDNEIVIETKHLDVVVKPSDGGTVTELSFKHQGYEHNIASTMNRYLEPYLSTSPTFRPDWYQRNIARDHLWNPTISLWDWVNNTPFVDQSDLALGRYQLLSIDNNSLVLMYRGYFYGKGIPIPVEAAKHIYVDSRAPYLKIIHRVKNIGNEPFTSRIGFDYHLSPKVPRKRGEEYPIYRLEPDTIKHLEEVWIGSGKRIELKGIIDLELSLDRDVDIWVAPIVMPTRTERGIMDIIQSMGIMFSRVVVLDPEKSFELGVELMFKV
ncbi:MAG: alpha-amylase/4-alpha-glucanotransferase domain-containing protein [Ignisphaera sp.]